jgi:hypothetical protein
MTNKHIELVKKWLADSNSVSLEELEAARDATHADAAADAAYAAAANAYDAAYANAADLAVAYAAGKAAYAAYWVKKYEELTNDK